ncbi:MAG: DUF2177 family protein [Legionellales bacterium]|jgi:uncharacterized membrane protein|nr:DUF2177 family protein [Legionellales bacterium]
MNSVVTFIYTFLLVLFIDYVWLSFIAFDFFQNNLGHMMREDIIIPAALAFYFVFTAGLLVFVIFPSQELNSLQQAIIKGGFFGFICYCTFDFTCYAIFKDFPAKIILVDLAWGTFIGAASSAIVVASSG